MCFRVRDMSKAFDDVWQIVKDYDSTVFEMLPPSVHGNETQSAPRFSYERASRLGNPITQRILDRFATKGYDKIVRDRILSGEATKPWPDATAEQLDRALAFKDVYDPDTKMKIGEYPDGEPIMERLGMTRGYCANAAGNLHEPLANPQGEPFVKPPYLRHGEPVPEPLENYPYEWTDEHGNLHQRSDPFPGMMQEMYDPDSGSTRREMARDQFGNIIRNERGGATQRRFPRLTTEEMLERYGKLIEDGEKYSNGREFDHHLAPSPDPAMYDAELESPNMPLGRGWMPPKREEWMGDYNQRTQVCPYCAPLPEGSTSTYGHHNPNDCPYLKYTGRERQGSSLWSDVLDTAGQQWDDEGYGILPFGGYRHHEYSPMEGGASMLRLVMGDDPKNYPMFVDRDEQKRSAIDAGMDVLSDKQRNTVCESCRGYYTPREKRDNEPHSPRAQDYIDDPENNNRYYDTVSVWNPSFAGTGRRNVADYEPSTGRAGYREVKWDPSRQKILHDDSAINDMKYRAGPCPNCGGRHTRRFVDDSYSGDSAIRGNQYMRLREWDETQDLVEQITGMRPRDLEEMSGAERLDAVSALGELPWTGIHFGDDDDDETPPR